jgi:deoxyribose-phosphate aldolase
MVMNVGAFCSGRYDIIENEVKRVASLCDGAALFKLIIETAHLHASTVGVASVIGADAGADFIKTSTGLAPRGATVDDVRRIRDAVGDRVGVKAAGGIRTRAEALSLVESGANRLGCSASLKVVALEQAEGSTG